jgi:hypothetical protein
MKIIFLVLSLKPPPILPAIFTLILLLSIESFIPINKKNMELGANLDSKRLNCGKQFDNQIDKF